MELTRSTTKMNTANQSGTYTWSNGRSGASITVDHGGPYRVRFQPDGTDCEVTETIIAPKSPDEYTWIFPTGCFEYCIDYKGTDANIIGPIPPFDGGYDYVLDQNTSVSSGAGVVPPFQLAAQQGALTLKLDNSYCTVITDELNLTPTEACKEDCKLDFVIKKVYLIQLDPFVVYALDGGIQNNYNVAISVELNSPDGQFSPGSAYIPANGFYDFAAHNLTYTPYNPANNGVDIEYSTSIHEQGKVEIICGGLVQFQTPKKRPFENNENRYAEMSVTPNPVQTVTDVLYTVKNVSNFKDGTIELYSLSGKLIQTKNVRKPVGTKTFDLTNLASGTYVLVFYHQDQRIGQQILIKN